MSLKGSTLPVGCVVIPLASSPLAQLRAPLAYLPIGNATRNTLHDPGISGCVNVPEYRLHHAPGRRGSEDPPRNICYCCQLYCLLVRRAGTMFFLAGAASTGNQVSLSRTLMTWRGIQGLHTDCSAPDEVFNLETSASGLGIVRSVLVSPL